MSLAEIEKQVRELPAAERQQFVSWVYTHEDELIDPPSAGAIAAEVMEELVRRRQELAAGTAKIITLGELETGMSEAIDEVRRSRQ